MNLGDWRCGLIVGALCWLALPAQAQPPIDRTLAQLASNAYEAGRYDEALGYYQQLLTANPKNPWVLMQTSMSHGAQKNYAQCIKYAQKGIKIKSDYQSVTYEVLGACLTDAGKERDAVKALAQGVKAFPKDGMLNYDYALALLRQQKVNEAVKPLQVAIDETPEYASPYLLYADLLNALGSRAGLSLMSLRFLMIEPDSDRAVEVVQSINKALTESSARFDLNSSANTLHISIGALLIHRELIDFDMLLPALSAKAKVAAEERHLNASDQFVWSLVALLTTMSNTSDPELMQGFVWTHAYNSLLTLSKRGVLDTYLYHVAAIGKLDGATQWLDEHDSDVVGLAKVMDEFPGGRLK